MLMISKELLLGFTFSVSLLTCSLWFLWAGSQCSNDRASAPPFPKDHSRSEALTAPKLGTFKDMF